MLYFQVKIIYDFVVVYVVPSSTCRIIKDGFRTKYYIGGKWINKRTNNMGTCQVHALYATGLSFQACRCGAEESIRHEGKFWEVPAFWYQILTRYFCFPLVNCFQNFTNMQIKMNIFCFQITVAKLVQSCVCGFMQFTMSKVSPTSWKKEYEEMQGFLFVRYNI